MMDIKTYTWNTKTRPGYIGIELLGGKKEGIELHEYYKI